MGKKKKIRKLTDEQYLAYIAGLKNDAALFDSNGDLLVPETFTKVKEEEENR